MSLSRFSAYAEAFERAYAADAWADLGPYFTDDAAYEIRMDGVSVATYRGRDAVLGYLARVTRAFDKRFASRRLVPFEPPCEGTDGVRLHGVALYTMPDGGCCHLVMEEHARFQGDRIAQLTDNIFPGGVAELQAIRARYPETFTEPMLPQG